MIGSSLTRFLRGDSLSTPLDGGFSLQIGTVFPKSITVMATNMQSRVAFGGWVADG